MPPGTVKLIDLFVIIAKRRKDLNLKMNGQIEICSLVIFLIIYFNN